MNKDEFKRATDGPVRQGDAERILAQIALSVENPDHIRGFKRSCYGYVAEALRTESFENDDEIILLGVGGNSYHAIIARGRQVLVDALGCKSFDPQAGTYISQMSHRSGEDVLTIVKKASYQEFCQRFSLSLGPDQSPLDP